MSYEEGRCSTISDFLPYIIRSLGVATAVVLWGIGFDMAYHHHVLGNCFIAASVLIFFFEVAWAVSLFLEVCIRSEHSLVLTCWSLVLWFDSWKKSVVYWTLATVLIVKPHKLFLTTLAGGMLITLGLLYFLQGIRRRFRSKEALLHQEEEHYDRFEDEAESINGDTSNDQESESVCNSEHLMQL